MQAKAGQLLRKDEMGEKGQSLRLGPWIQEIRLLYTRAKKLLYLLKSVMIGQGMDLR
jgi:hypothetical protein